MDRGLLQRYGKDIFDTASCPSGDVQIPWRGTRGTWSTRRSWVPVLRPSPMRCVPTYSKRSSVGGQRLPGRLGFRWTGRPRAVGREPLNLLMHQKREGGTPLGLAQVVSRYNSAAAIRDNWQKKRGPVFQHRPPTDIYVTASRLKNVLFQGRL